MKKKLGSIQVVSSTKLSSLLPKLLEKSLTYFAKVQKYLWDVTLGDLWWLFSFSRFLLSTILSSLQVIVLIVKMIKYFSVTFSNLLVWLFSHWDKSNFLLSILHTKISSLKVWIIKMNIFSVTFPDAVLRADCLRVEPFERIAETVGTSSGVDGTGRIRSPFTPINFYLKQFQCCQVLGKIENFEMKSFLFWEGWALYLTFCSICVNLYS